MAGIRRGCAVAILSVSLVLASHAEESMHHEHGAASAQSSDTAATKAFREADARMHRDMAIRYSNDVDLDFVRGMIPHHAGAIDMARIALDHSKDPEIRKLAEDIVKAQETEIAQMKAFLERRGKSR